MRRLLGWLAIAALLGGCATYELTGTGPTGAEDKSYTVALPPNWVRLSSATDRVVVTRDGFGLQRILITRSAAKDAFPKIKKSADERAARLRARRAADRRAQVERPAAGQPHRARERACEGRRQDRLQGPHPLPQRRRPRVRPGLVRRARQGLLLPHQLPRARAVLLRQVPAGFRPQPRLVQAELSAPPARRASAGHADKSGIGTALLAAPRPCR